MLKIGITGGIGSGKTTVCQVFETFGIPVFYADRAAKAAMTGDETLVTSIKDHFGAGSYHPDGKLNNQYLAGMVFQEQAALETLNSLVHPAVFKAFDKWAEEWAGHTPYVLKEAALLFESGSYQQCDKNILVTAPAELRIQRVMQRDAVTSDQVRARMDKQFSDEQKEKMADYLIYNTEKESIILQVMALHQKILDLKKEADALS